MHLVDGQLGQRDGVVGMAGDKLSQRSAGPFFVFQTLLQRELAGQETGAVPLLGFELVDQFQAACILPALQRALDLIQPPKPYRSSRI